MHYREPTFEGRGANKDRDIAPDHPIALAKFVLEDLGGQVVRIGHPEMTPFPDLPGFVDLSREPVDFFLQAAAVRRARFFLEPSPSGPMALALCFGVPVLRCNNVAPWGALDGSSLLLHQHIVGPDGATLPLEICAEKNLLNGNVVPFMLAKRGYRYSPNTLDEMIAATRALCDSTADCPAWRQIDAVPGLAVANHVAWPPPTTERHRVMGLATPVNRN